MSFCPQLSLLYIFWPWTVGFVMALFRILIFSLVLLIFSYKLATTSNDVEQEDISTITNISIKRSDEFRIFFCACYPPMRIPFNSNTTYESFIKQLKDQIEKNTSNTRNFKIETRLLGYTYKNDCSNVYSKFIACFDAYNEELKTTTFHSILLHGPWCTLDIYDRDVKKLRRIVSNLPNELDVSILTVMQNFLPVYGADYLLHLRDHPDQFVKTYARSLMFLTGGIERMGYGFWYLLAVHFKYRHIALVVLGEEAVTTFSHCSRQLETFQIIASISKEYIVVNYYKWAVTNYTSFEKYVEIWKTLKDVARIILLCAQDNYSLKFVQVMEMDRKETKQDVYGLFIVHRNIETYNSFMRRLIEDNVSQALMYIKLIVANIDVCKEYTSDIMPKVLNDSSDFNMQRRDLGATYDKYIGSTYCAILHYYRQIGIVNKTVGQRLASIFADTYRTDIPRLITRKGRAIQWLPVMIVYSPEKNISVVKPVLEVNWNSTDHYIEVYVKELGKMTWYNKDEPLFDGLYMCDNLSSFYPCPQKVAGAKLSTIQIVIIVCSSLIGLVVIGAVISLPIRYYVRNNRNHLLRKWLIPMGSISTKEDKYSQRVVVGWFKNERVLILPVETKAERDILKSADMVREFDQIATFSKRHDNQIVQLVGFICGGNANLKLVYSWGANRNLRKILNLLKLSFDLRLSLIRDLAVSLSSIHDSDIKVHGELTSDVCGVDERFILRVLLTRIPTTGRYKWQRNRWNDIRPCNLLWTAPELIRNSELQPNQASDVYSFGIIMHEILFQRGPFFSLDLQGNKHVRKMLLAPQKEFVSPKDDTKDEKSDPVPSDNSCAELIVEKIKNGPVTPSMPAKYVALDSIIDNCWNEETQKRLSMASIVTCLKEYMKINNVDIAFKMVKRLTLISRQMVKELNKKNSEVIRERDRCLKYLMHMMPPSVSYEFMKEESDMNYEHCESVTIYFNDLVDFKTINKEPLEVIQLFDELFQAYDKIVKFYNVLPLHRVGSSLLLASGVQDKTPAHASEIAQAALQIRQFIKTYRRTEIRLRAGIHSGSVTSGVVGKNIPQFGLFGDTVNTASRMSSSGEVGEIQVSEMAFALLQPLKKFVFTAFHKKPIKGKDIMKTCWLRGYDGYNEALPTDRRLDRHAPKSKSKSSRSSSNNSGKQQKAEEHSSGKSRSFGKEKPKSGKSEKSEGKSSQFKAKSAKIGSSSKTILVKNLTINAKAKKGPAKNKR